MMKNHQYFYAILAVLLVFSDISNAEQPRSEWKGLLPSQESIRSTIEIRGGGLPSLKQLRDKVLPPPPKPHKEEHLMTAPIAIANVLADLCPHGMLPIAFGMAAGGGTGPVLSTIILFFFGFLSWYSLVSFARAADAVLVNEKEEVGESLSAVWERILPNGKATKYIPDLGCVALTVGCLLFYSAFIGDIFGSLVSGMSGLPSILRKRWSVLLLLHVAPILPLCLKKDLSALQYSSMTGLVGIFYTVFFVGKRLVDGSYAEGGKFYDLMPSNLHPAPLKTFSHDTNGGIWSYLTDIPPFYSGKGLLILMNMCCGK